MWITRMITTKMVSGRLRVWYLSWIVEVRKARQCYELVKATLAAVDRWSEKDYSGC